MLQYNYSINEQKRVILMNKNLYFKPTPLYKEFMILDLIEKKSNITQRAMSSELGVAVSMINTYLVNCEEKKYIIREYFSSKNVAYKITKKGVERKKVLNIGFLNSSYEIYQLAKGNIKTFLNQITKKGFRNIFLYGAGEVAEILLQTINGDSTIPLNVIGVIDDDVEKQNLYLENIKILSLSEIYCLTHDGILISSYTNRKIILSKLKKRNYNPTNILNFFEIYNER